MSLNREVADGLWYPPAPVSPTDNRLAFLLFSKTAHRFLSGQLYIGKRQKRLGDEGMSNRQKQSSLRVKAGPRDG